MTPGFCPYYGGFFHCVLNSEGLLREVPLYVLHLVQTLTFDSCIFILNRKIINTKILKVALFKNRDAVINLLSRLSHSVIPYIANGRSMQNKL